jgi:hypothetical protein
MMMIDLNAHDHTAASQIIELLATVVAGIAIFLYAVVQKRAMQLRWRDTLNVRHLRLMIGASIELFGRSVGTASYLPAWPLLSAGRDTWVEGYVSWVAPLPIAAGLLTAGGVLVIFWPRILRMFGRWTAIAVPVALVVIYFAGAVANALIASLLSV